MRLTVPATALCAALFSTPVVAQEAACHPTRDEALANARHAADAVHGAVIVVDAPLAQAAMARAAEAVHAAPPPITGMIIVEFMRDGEKVDLVGMVGANGCLAGILPMSGDALLKLLGPAA